MVFIALNNNEIIFAHNSSKGKYKCIYSNEKIFLLIKVKMIKSHILDIIYYKYVYNQQFIYYNLN